MRTRLTSLKGGRKTFAIALTLLCITMLALSTPALAAAKPQEDKGERGRGKGPETQEASETAPRGKAWGHQNVNVTKGSILNVTATGHAFNITDPSINMTARVTFNATVGRASWGRAKLNVTAGQLSIEGIGVYAIERGTGLITLRSSKLLVHLVVRGPEGNLTHVVLKGNLAASLPTTFNVNNTVGVNFLKPQSKLAAQFFLELSGNITRAA